jgi:hypothetical protein
MLMAIGVAGKPEQENGSHERMQLLANIWKNP